MIFILYVLKSLEWIHFQGRNSSKGKNLSKLDFILGSPTHILRNATQERENNSCQLIAESMIDLIVWIHVPSQKPLLDTNTSTFVRTEV